ncbi:hypothetical protein AGMMS49940_19920 [Spirochaetia bacterium]|nr:hypothetical protein AGMMS49940_19920 [Spirochaetia bacterium]
MKMIRQINYIIILLVLLFVACEKAVPGKTAVPEKTDVYRKAVILEDTDDRGISLVKELTGISRDIEIKKSGWIDLDGDGDYKEYFALYIVYGDGDNYGSYLHLAIVKDDWEGLIYHMVHDDAAFDIDFFQRNEKTQVMYYYQGGSAIYLSFSIFEYDPRRMFNEFYEIFEGHIGSYGGYYFLNQKLLFSGNGGKYNLVFADGSYRLEDYDGRECITAPNELSFVYEHEKDIFKILFNGNEIRFREDEERRHMVNINPIHIPKDTLVLCNDYLKPDRFDISIRYSPDTMEVIDGFYSIFKFTEKGYSEIPVRADRWYNIRFLVE